jgi:hypothetical protein
VLELLVDSLAAMWGPFGGGTHQQTQPHTGSLAVPIFLYGMILQYGTGSVFQYGTGTGMVLVWYSGEYAYGTGMVLV